MENLKDLLVELIHNIVEVLERVDEPEVPEHNPSDLHFLRVIWGLCSFLEGKLTAFYNRNELLRSAYLELYKGRYQVRNYVALRGLQEAHQSVAAFWELLCESLHLDDEDVQIGVMTAENMRRIFEACNTMVAQVESVQHVVYAEPLPENFLLPLNN